MQTFNRATASPQPETAPLSITWAYQSPSTLDECAAERLRYTISCSTVPELAHIIAMGDEHGNGKIFSVASLYDFFVTPEFKNMAWCGIRKIKAIPCLQAQRVVDEIKRIPPPPDLDPLSYDELCTLVGALMAVSDHAQQVKS